MKTLIVEDDYASRTLMNRILSPYGHCETALDGKEAIEAFQKELTDNNGFDLVCLDIRMPNMDGQEALVKMRGLEKEHGVKPDNEAKIIMTTALDDPKNIIEALYKSGATSYLVKPITKNKLVDEIRKLNLIEE
ncbi:MAG: response regulator [Vulcanimicrobiota bacterium]